MGILCGRLIVEVSCRPIRRQTHQLVQTSKRQTVKHVGLLASEGGECWPIYRSLSLSLLTSSQVEDAGGFRGLAELSVGHPNICCPPYQPSRRIAVLIDDRRSSLLAAAAAT